MVTSGVVSISLESILTTAVEGAFSVAADLKDAAVVCFDGTLVNV